MKRLYIALYLIMTAFWCNAIYAGWLTNSIGKSISKKSAAQAAQHAASRKAAAVNSAHALTTAEKLALQNTLKKLDRDALIAIERKFGSYISPERLKLAQHMPVVFKNKAEYQQFLKNVLSQRPKSERVRIRGHYDRRGNKIYVDQNNPLLPKVVAHERMHQLGSPGFHGLLSNNMEEGMTEYFARKIYGDMAIKGLPRIYPKEVRIIEMLNSRIGTHRLSQAYFQGEIGLLQRSIDGRLGRGALLKISNAMKSRDYLLAERIIRGGL